MIRLLGVDLPRKKKIYVALTSIYGIGYSTAFKILEQSGINSETKVEALNPDEVNTLRFTLENGEYKLEGDLKRLINMNVKRLIDISSYRGRRHIKGLPTRGQRTRTNCRTCRNVRVYTMNRKVKK